MTDLTYRDSIISSLAQAAAKVAERALADMPDEAQATLAPAVLAGNVTLVVSVRLGPLQVAVHAMPAVATVVDVDPVLLLEIKGPEEAATESYDNRN